VWAVLSRTRSLMNRCVRCVRSGGTAKMTTEERESRMRDLAQQLLFTVEKTDDRYTLIRTADVSRPVNEKGLTLKQAEDLLETWKLRGQGWKKELPIPRDAVQGVPAEISTS
jgi:hypothetical protein